MCFGLELEVLPLHRGVSFTDDLTQELSLKCLLGDCEVDQVGVDCYLRSEGWMSVLCGDVKAEFGIYRNGLGADADGVTGFAFDKHRFVEQRIDALVSIVSNILIKDFPAKLDCCTHQLDKLWTVVIEDQQ